MLTDVHLFTISSYEYFDPIFKEVNNSNFWKAILMISPWHKPKYFDTHTVSPKDTGKDSGILRSRISDQKKWHQPVNPITPWFSWIIRKLFKSDWQKTVISANAHHWHVIQEGNEEVRDIFGACTSDCTSRVYWRLNNLAIFPEESIWFLNEKDSDVAPPFNKAFTFCKEKSHIPIVLSLVCHQTVAIPHVVSK